MVKLKDFDKSYSQEVILTARSIINQTLNSKKTIQQNLAVKKRKIIFFRFFYRLIKLIT